MAGETTTGKNDKKTGDAAKAGGAAKADESKSDLKHDVAGKAPLTREEILALHRKATEGKDVITSDVVGYWNSDDEGLPLSGVPERDIVAIDSGIDKTKPSLLMKVKATLPTMIEDADGNEQICNAGDLVGVWFKPGMRDIRNLAGLEVTITRDVKRDKDTGKGNKMKGYAIYAKGTGHAMRIAEDRREKSKKAKTVFDVEQAPPSADTAPRNAPALYEDGDKLPF